MSLKIKLSVFDEQPPSPLSRRSSPDSPRWGGVTNSLEEGVTDDFAGSSEGHRLHGGARGREGPAEAFHAAASPTAASPARNAGAPGGRAYRSPRVSGAARFLSAVHPDGL